MGWFVTRAAVLPLVHCHHIVEHLIQPLKKHSLQRQLVQTVATKQEADASLVEVSVALQLEQQQFRHLLGVSSILNHVLAPFQAPQTHY